VSLGLLNNHSPLLSVFRGWLLGFGINYFFAVWGCQPHAQPSPCRTRVSLFVWGIPLDQSGTGGPTSSMSYRQHSSRVHVSTQTPPLRQSRDTFGGGLYEARQTLLFLDI
jgi:hypothetical protein